MRIHHTGMGLDKHHPRKRAQFNDTRPGLGVALVSRQIPLSLVIFIFLPHLQPRDVHQYLDLQTEVDHNGDASDYKGEDDSGHCEANSLWDLCFALIRAAFIEDTSSNDEVTPASIQYLGDPLAEDEHTELVQQAERITQTYRTSWEAQETVNGAAHHHVGSHWLVIPIRNYGGYPLRYFFNDAMNFAHWPDSMVQKMNV